MNDEESLLVKKREVNSIKIILKVGIKFN